MAIGVNLTGAPFRLNAQEAGGQPSYMDALLRGFKGAQEAAETVYKPKNLAEKLLDMQLQNKINAPKAEHAEEFAQADLKAKLAQAARLNQLSSQPFNGMLAGSAKEAYALEQLKSKFGEDSPLYQNALRSFNANVSAKEALTDYRGALSGTAEQRALTQFGKLQHEENDVIEGFEPGTNRQARISPERQQELLGQYQLQRQKTATDADTRKKVLYATNIDKTIQRINPEDLTKFGGITGQIELKKQEALSAANEPTSKDFENYKKAESNAKLLAKQVRQFYGDSIQPTVLAKLEALTNPTTWKNNPKIASQIYKSFVETLKTETDTYKSALGNTNIFRNEKKQENDPLGLR